MSAVQRKWRKSEGGIVGRFGDPRKALKSVALVLADGEVNATRQSFVVDPGLQLRQLKLRLIPKLDHAHLSTLPEDDLGALGVSLVLRDPGVKRFTLIDAWPLGDLPESVPLGEGPEFERVVRDQMVVSVGLTILRDAGELETGTTLARKDFHIRTDASGSKFPHQFVDPSYFEEQGLPRTTSWFVHVMNEDGDKSADDTFVVYINSELVEVASSKAADAVWASLASEVFSVLLLSLLKGEVPEEPVHGSILEQIGRQVSSLGHSIHEVSGWVRDSDVSKVMAISQSITRVNSLLRGAL